MALVALDGTPLVAIGFAGRELTPLVASLANVTQDATNEATIMIGQLFWTDGGSHTVDTTGSSSLGFRTGTVTFANAATTFKVGLAAADTATGPPGRAANASDVITFDVEWSGVGGGGGITTNAWQEKVPTSGTKTIAHGATIAFCTQMTARGGVDSIITSVMNASNISVFPFVTGFLAAAYTAQIATPNAVVTASDGTLGFFYGSGVATSIGSQTWNSGSATKEYGNLITLPFPSQIYGIAAGVSIGGDTDFVLYSDPLGTPVAEKTASQDANTIGIASALRYFVKQFTSPYSATANQQLGVIFKPGATNITASFVSMNTATHQQAWSPYTGCYAINRASGAFATQNSNKDRFGIGLLVGAFDSGTGGGISRARAASGF